MPPRIRFHKYSDILITPHSKQAPAATVSLNGCYARQNTSLVQVSERQVSSRLLFAYLQT